MEPQVFIMQGGPGSRENAVEYRLYGPFKSIEAAAEWADEMLGTVGWWPIRNCLPWRNL